MLIVLFNLLVYVLFYYISGNDSTPEKHVKINAALENKKSLYKGFFVLYLFTSSKMDK
jgi:hypothetical protein